MSIQIQLPRGWPAYAFVSEWVVVSVWLVYTIGVLWVWFLGKTGKLRLTL